MSDLFKAVGNHKFSEHQIPFDFLHKGQEFMVIKLTSLGNIQGIYRGVADMDGHSISDQYGFRNERGSVYHLDGVKNYINVKISSADRADKYKKMTASVNESLDFTNVPDGKVWVSPEAYEQYLKDVAYNENLRRERSVDAQAAERKRKLEAAIVEAQASLSKLQLELDLENRNR